MSSPSKSCLRATITSILSRPMAYSAAAIGLGRADGKRNNREREHHVVRYRHDRQLRPGPPPACPGGGGAVPILPAPFLSALLLSSVISLGLDFYLFPALFGPDVLLDPQIQDAQAEGRLHGRALELLGQHYLLLEIPAHYLDLVKAFRARPSSPDA